MITNSLEMPGSHERLEHNHPCWILKHERPTEIHNMSLKFVLLHWSFRSASIRLPSRALQVCPPNKGSCIIWA
jgi:hypothetical protein